jgi:hypothetical protein
LPRIAFGSIPVDEPAAVVQRQKNKKKSLRARVREKLAASQALSAREKRFAPIRPPAPSPVRPTIEQLAAGRANLKRADYGVAHPDLRGIRVRRDAGQSAEHYTDLLTDTRASISRLAEKPVGQQLLTGLNARTQQVHPGQVGNDRTNPLTVVDIRSGRGLAPDSAMSHIVRHNNTYSDAQRGYRYDGKSGAGIASRVNYDESRARPDRFISLGHELVHAYRAAHGNAVSAPEISPQRDHRLLKAPTDPVVRQVIGQHAHLREEFETVGLLPTPRVANPPTEAGIRAEHSFPARTDYSGLRPGGKQDTSLREIDEGTDDRGPVDKYWHKKPTPVASIVKHLED